MDDIYSEAEKAFEALSFLLGDDEWFFGSVKPGLFDAAVFAYTHLLLDDGLGNGWGEQILCRMVKKRKNSMIPLFCILCLYTISVQLT